MSSVITALTNSETGLTAASFYDVIADLAPFLIIMVPVALGIYFLRKLVKGTTKAKVKF